MKPADASNPPISRNRVLTFGEAYAQVLPELEQLPAKSVLRMNFDLDAAVWSVCTSYSKIIKFRAEVKKKLPSVNLRSFDQLKIYALALLYAENRFKTAPSPLPPLDGELEELTTFRTLFYGDVAQAAKRNLMSDQILGKLKGANGAVNIASDVSLLAMALEASWPRIKGRVGAKWPELNRALNLTVKFLPALFEKRRTRNIDKEALDLRNRAFTLLVNAYDEVRQAITFIRWKQKDADEIVPSLHAAPRKKKKAEKTTAIAPAPQAASTQANTGGADATQAPPWPPPPPYWYWLQTMAAAYAAQYPTGAVEAAAAPPWVQTQSNSPQGQLSTAALSGHLLGPTVSGGGKPSG